MNKYALINTDFIRGKKRKLSCLGAFILKVLAGNVISRCCVYLDVIQSRAKCLLPKVTVRPRHAPNYGASYTRSETCTDRNRDRDPDPKLDQKPEQKPDRDTEQNPDRIRGKTLEMFG